MRRSLKRTGKVGTPARVTPAVAQLLAQAGETLRMGQDALAARMLDRALKMAPRCVDAWRMRGMLEQMSGRHCQALGFLRRACELDDGDARNHMALGMALHDDGDTDAALAELRRACELAPDSAAAWFNLGKVLKQRDQGVDEACDALERVLDLEPEHISARLALADARLSLGDIDTAIAHFRAILQHDPAQHRAWLGWANIRRDPFTSEDLARLKSAHARADPDSEAGIMLGFALSRALESQGEYASAFNYLAAANAAQRRQVRWPAQAEAQQLKSTEDVFAQPPTTTAAADRGREVIFVVSLPRAGSSLVEQILASHSQVEGAGEILDLQRVIDAESDRRGQPFPQWVQLADNDDWARLGQAYLDRTAHWRSECPRMIDKNLLNWQLVGAALAMLPGARFVNVRRDPVETCLACYRQLFRTGNGFSYDLEDMAHWWQSYDRLCRHWQTIYPQRFIDLRYESLTAHPEAAIRQLLDTCELSFEPGCLDFHRTRRLVRTASAAQVREPVRADTARADRYGEALAPLRALLISAKAVTSGA